MSLQPFISWERVLVSGSVLPACSGHDVVQLRQTHPWPGLSSTRGGVDYLGSFGMQDTINISSTSVTKSIPSS
jgi:hypothetical protein